MVMVRVLSFSLIVLVAFLSAVKAEQSPKAAASDWRIKRYVYDENNVYKLDLYLKSITAIQFAQGETIESILVGDSASWEVVKLKVGNVMSVKPIIDQALTNMTVYTDRRIYTFELRTVGEIKAGMQAGARQAFRTTFIYPDESKAPHEGAGRGLPINYGYAVSGDARFRPIAVTDNTLQTTFIVPRGAPRPAVFMIGQDREEKLVNSRTDGDRIVVDGISEFWVMRIGDDTVCVAKASAVRMAPQ
ncbi:TrbG/VirB9 family P-type conjugative transfer protein (plasmid) [Bradyrhizobium quebecense]|uniref:TrbG/VirB9 family P-type conjugative transfer protein n=1 Tax=Bradyrhizobium quebecense TaxID=2748629 RepID=A0A974AIQ7_9BRAD|nr:TrbG/VirB9 family P-type conjugative transfer protein [Bradyrhizobium quebecense]UGA49004.1 TrbG/VirB9 family P-type conjugative transfer protein [Bradyrhizobium quebecense]